MQISLDMNIVGNICDKVTTQLLSTSLLADMIPCMNWVPELVTSPEYSWISLRYAMLVAANVVSRS